MEVRSLTFPLGPVLDAHGKPAVGHALACYNPGTDTLRSWYADPQLTVPAPNPDRVGADGRIAQKFLWDGVSEIRQYAPVSASSTIPDNLQDFPGTEWSLVASWLEDGLHPTSGETILTVDTVDDLRTLLNEKATEGLVAVRGYSAADDEIGVRFYQFVAGSTQNDDGGAVLNSGLGGRWFLKVQTSDVDVRWWGARPNKDEDSTSAISSAAAWSNANAVTLYFPAGIYTVSCGSVTLADAHLADGVTFKATAGAYALNLSGRWAVDGRVALKDAASSYAVNVNFVYGADVGKCYLTWNADRDISHFTGQNLVVPFDANQRINGDGSVKELVLEMNAIASGTLTVDTLVTNGTTLTMDDPGKLSVVNIKRETWAPAAIGRVDNTGDGEQPGKIMFCGDVLRSSDLTQTAFEVVQLTSAGLPDQVVRLIVDEDRSLPKGRYSWSNVTIVTGGGLLSIASDGGSQPCNGIAPLSIEGEGSVFGTGFDYWSYNSSEYLPVAPATLGCLKAHHFNGDLNAAKTLALAKNNGSRVYLEGKTVNGWTLSIADGYTAGDLSAFFGPGVVNSVGSVFANTMNFRDVTVQFSYSTVGVTNISAIFENCNLYGDGTSIVLGAATNYSALLHLRNCSIRDVGLKAGGASEAPSACELRVEDCTFLDEREVEAADGVCLLMRNTFKGQVTLKGWFDSVRIQSNYMTKTGSGPIIDYTDLTGVSHVCITDNMPSKYNGGGYYWQQTEGAFAMTASTNEQLYKSADNSGIVANIFKPAIESNGTVVITPHGAHAVDYALTQYGISDLYITNLNVPTGNVPQNVETQNSDHTVVQIDVVYNFTK